MGGGECIDPEDCSNNGICNPKSGGKGVCCCVVGFAGANCNSKRPFLCIYQFGKQCNGKLLKKSATVSIYHLKQVCQAFGRPRPSMWPPGGILNILKLSDIFLSPVLDGIEKVGSPSFLHCLACQIGEFR